VAKSRTKEPAVAENRRALSKARRHEHRDDIQARWDRRRANQRFSERMKPENLPQTLSDLLGYGRWAPHADLLEYVPAEMFKPLLLHALRVIELKELPYDEYLQSPEWKARAHAAKQRYLGRCALDATHPADDAHHRTYDRRGREHPTDIVPLCRACHDKFHKR
jgi:hypothetical protein